MSEPKFSYLAFAPCGCFVGARVDDQDKNTAKDVADFIKSGCIVQRYSHNETMSMFADKGFGCKCKKEANNLVDEKQPALF